MSVSLTSKAATRRSSTTSLERRCGPRQPVVRQLVYARRTTASKSEWRLAWLTDISDTGIGLVMAAPVETHTHLEVEMHDLERHSVRTCHLTVQHATAIADGCWLLGGVLHDPAQLDGCC